MSEGQLATVILLGTFAFALVLAGGASLVESEDREKELKISDFDPSGLASTLSIVMRVFVYTFEWKYENRVGLSLMWSGIACAVAAFVCAVL